MGKKTASVKKYMGKKPNGLNKWVKRQMEFEVERR